MISGSENVRNPQNEQNFVGKKMRSFIVMSTVLLKRLI